MSIRTRIIIGVVVVLAIIALTRMIQKKKLEVKHALLWYVLAIVILAMVVFPSILDTMTRFSGVELAVNMLFFLGFCFSLVIIFIMTVWISNLTIKEKRLIQELALLEKKVEELSGHIDK